MDCIRYLKEFSNRYFKSQQIVSEPTRFSLLDSATVKIIVSTSIIASFALVWTLTRLQRKRHLATLRSFSSVLRLEPTMSESNPEKPTPERRTYVKTESEERVLYPSGSGYLGKNYDPNYKKKSCIPGAIPLRSRRVPNLYCHVVDDTCPLEHLQGTTNLDTISQQNEHIINDMQYPPEAIVVALRSLFDRVDTIVNSLGALKADIDNLEDKVTEIINYQKTHITCVDPDAHRNPQTKTNTISVQANPQPGPSTSDSTKQKTAVDTALTKTTHLNIRQRSHRSKGSSKRSAAARRGTRVKLPQPVEIPKSSETKGKAITNKPFLIEDHSRNADSNSLIKTLQGLKLNDKLIVTKKAKNTKKTSGKGTVKQIDSKAENSKFIEDQIKDYLSLKRQGYYSII